MRLKFHPHDLVDLSFTRRGLFVPLVPTPTPQTLELPPSPPRATPSPTGSVCYTPPSSSCSLRICPLTLRFPFSNPLSTRSLFADRLLLLPSHSSYACPLFFLILIYLPLILCVPIICQVCTVVRAVEPPPSPFIPVPLSAHSLTIPR